MRVERQSQTVRARYRATVRAEGQLGQKETDAVHADFILLLNAYNIVNFHDGSLTFDGLIAALNADIDYYRTWVLKKGGSAQENENSSDGGSSDGSDTPTPTPDPSDGDGDE